jgi:fluoride exporter
MSPVVIEPAHLVGTGGAIGALLRHGLSVRVAREDFPLGTLSVNVIGSFLLGLLTFAGIGGDPLLFLGTGLCGSFTTFSSFSVDTVRLYETGKRRRAVANALGNLLGAGLALGLAWALVALVGM